MSTNYYLKRKVSAGKKSEIISRIKHDEWDKASELFSEAMKYSKIHLGKRSYGWQFVWALNGEKYYKPSQKSINDFLSDEICKHGSNLIDEYEREITLDQFWNDEIGDSLRRGKITDEDWMLQNNIRYSRNWFGEDKKWAEKYNVNFCGNFISEDGLKFCINDFC